MARSRLLFEAGLVGVLGVAVFGSTVALVQNGRDYGFLDPVIDVKSTLTSQYVESLTPEMLRKMQDGAIRGMVEALDDPYTVYVPPSDVSSFDKDLTGEYVGIGASVQMIDGVLIIISPLEDSPAFRIGLMADDKVIEIEGQPTLGLSVDQCIERLMGKEDTVVKILVDRKGTKMPFEITRKKIKTKNVKGVRRTDADPNAWHYDIDPKNGIMYIRLAQFTPGVANDIAKALDDCGVRKGNVKGLVLDVRWNPGGLLDEAVAIADLFLTEGTIVSTKSPRRAEAVAKAKAPGTLPDFPMAILVNGSSASASEVLAGALSENNRAVVIGTRSYGKASVQSVRPIKVVDPDGTVKLAELKVTEQGYYLPSGRSISRKGDAAEWGVDPSKGFWVEMTDAQLGDMIKVRRDAEIIRTDAPAAAGSDKPSTPPADKPKWDDGDWVLDHLKDPQLTAAVKAVREKQASGQWKPTGGEAVVMNKGAIDEIQKLRAARDRLTRDLIRIDRREESLAKAVGQDQPAVKDLWSDAVDVTGGKVQVFDKDGKLVTTLDITANTLERWLIDADVKKSVEEAAK